MVKITGMILKKESKIVVSTGLKAVVEWSERSSRTRTYYYLIQLKGGKYTQVYRLEPYEIDYWIDTLTKINEIRGTENGRTKNNTNKQGRWSGLYCSENR